MFNAFKNVCDFVCIYIQEAHASDEWPVRTKKSLCVKQHQTLTERCLRGKSLVDEYLFEMPVYVDTMRNTFEATYGAWPLRAFIIQKERIVFMLEPRFPGYYDLNDLFVELKKRFPSY